MFVLFPGTRLWTYGMHFFVCYKWRRMWAGILATLLYWSSWEFIADVVSLLEIQCLLFIVLISVFIFIFRNINGRYMKYSSYWILIVINAICFTKSKWFYGHIFTLHSKWIDFYLNALKGMFMIMWVNGKE